MVENLYNLTNVLFVMKNNKENTVAIKFTEKEMNTMAEEVVFQLTMFKDATIHKLDGVDLYIGIFFNDEDVILRYKYVYSEDLYKLQEVWSGSRRTREMVFDVISKEVSVHKYSYLGEGEIVSELKGNGYSESCVKLNDTTYWLSNFMRSGSEFFHGYAIDTNTSSLVCRISDCGESMEIWRQY